MSLDIFLWDRTRRNQTAQWDVRLAAIGHRRFSLHLLTVFSGLPRQMMQRNVFMLRFTASSLLCHCLLEHPAALKGPTPLWTGSLVIIKMQMFAASQTESRPYTTCQWKGSIVTSLLRVHQLIKKTPSCMKGDIYSSWLITGCVIPFNHLLTLVNFIF